MLRQQKAMSDISQIHRLNDVVYPVCAKCITFMVLKRVHPHINCYMGKFECDTCGRVVRDVIRLESPSISPGSQIKSGASKDRTTEIINA